MTIAPIASSLSNTDALYGSSGNVGDKKLIKFRSCRTIAVERAEVPE